MFRKERVQRAARAIDDELFHMRNGFMAPLNTFETPSTTAVHLAEAAVLAADGDTDALTQLRASRAMWLELMHGEVASIEAVTNIEDESSPR